MPSQKRCFEVTGQLEHFTEKLKSALIAWCEKNNYEYAYIYHDKDIKHDDDTNEDVVKPSHIHFMVNTGSTKWPFDALLNRFASDGLKSQMLQKVRKGWNNALSYLVHRTEGAVNDGKHLYELSEVVANFDYATTIGVIESQVEEKKTRIDEVIEKIESLECRRYNIHKFIDCADYSKKGNKIRIDTAFQYVETKLLEERKGRQMKVIWIYGKSGIGKTTLAKTICENNKWSFAISSSSNDALQDYNGQDCLILDDFRANGWSKTDVLKMLDNNTSSSIKSRYQNKQTCYLKCIIVTTIQAPLEFWQDGNWSSSGSEPYTQLSRRINQLVEMIKDEEEGQFARTYFYVTRYGYDGNLERKKYDFTDKLESLRREKEKEEEDTSFGGIVCVGLGDGSLSVKNTNIDKNGNLKVDEKDIPPF